MSQAQYITIDTFLGVNKKTTETLLKLGEASDMVNFIITDDGKLLTMYGYQRLFDPLGAYRINGMWHGTLNGVNHLLFASGGHVYEHDLETGANTDLGTVQNAYPTTFWVANNTVYIMDGAELYSWSGSGSITAVDGYVPTVLTAATPAGGGTILESINYLTGQKKVRISPDGAALNYQLPENNIESVDLVVLNGTPLTEGVEYTVNLTNGVVMFTSPPDELVNSLEVTWTKEIDGDREMITRNKYYGGSFAERFWLFGHPDNLNTRFVSGITLAGVTDPTYWPKYADSDVGEYEISDIVSQYNRQVIFTKGNEAEASAWYSYKETYTDPSTGLLVTIFPVEPINKKIGNVAKGQTQILYNNPVTIWKGIYEWVATNVVDEKNAQWISSPIQNDLDKVDLTQALTVDWSDKGQYWLCVGKKIWVLNYRVGAWYILELGHTPTCFAIVDSKLYFGTDSGTIMRFDETVGTFDGQDINAYWDMGSYNLGVAWLLKFVRELYITIYPYAKTMLKIYVQSDKDDEWIEIDPVSYAPLDFENLDFDSIDFVTNYNPQPFRRKIKLKKIGYIKLRLSNDGKTKASVLEITIPMKTGGRVKKR